MRPARDRTRGAEPQTGDCDEAWLTGMKYTLFLTQQCNLACKYCYVAKKPVRMALSVAEKIVDFAYRNTPPAEDINIGFFGGEPLLEFPLLQQIVRTIEGHEGFDACRVHASVVTNGTLLTEEMIRYFRRHNIDLTLSCDGPPGIHDRFRRFPDGSGSSGLVEDAIRRTLGVLGRAPVSAVYGPDTIGCLVETIDYFSSLGVRQIYVSPDFSARWTEAGIERVPAIYKSVAERYMKFYREGREHFISVIDAKIAVLLRGGYQPLERCRMGTGEFAFTASGHVLPCERLAAREPEEHSIGATNGLIDIGPLRDHFTPGPPVNTPCLSCGIQEYCMNWCGCSNYFMTGSYNRVSPFLCASERALIAVAFDVLRTLEEELGPTFVDHVGGLALAPSERPPKDQALKGGLRILPGPLDRELTAN